MHLSLRNLWNSAPRALGPFGPIKLLEYQTDLDLDFRALRECDPRQVLSTFQCKWIIATAFYEHQTPTTDCKNCAIWWKPIIIVLTVCQTGWDPHEFGQLQLTRWPYSSLLREQEDTPSVIMLWVSDSHISSRDFSISRLFHIFRNWSQKRLGITMLDLFQSKNHFPSSYYHS